MLIGRIHYLFFRIRLHGLLRGLITPPRTHSMLMESHKMNGIIATRDGGHG